MAPVWWQLLKALTELGHEVIMIPFYGRTVESPWWQAYQNPLATVSKLNRAGEALLLKLPFFTDFMDLRNRTTGFRDAMLRLVLPRFTKQLTNTARSERELDAVILFTIPMKYLRGVPDLLRKEVSCPLIYYDGDAPASLPRFGGLSGTLYHDSAVSQYDGVIVTSKGAVDDVRQMGARRVFFISEGADPSVFTPLSIEKDIDVSYFGIGPKYRAHWIDSMLSGPSMKLAQRKFAIAGVGFERLNLGRARYLGMTNYRRFCCRSKVTLHIARQPLAEVYASSSSKLFELACMGSCIVCNPINGLSEWFEEGKEVFVAHDEGEAVELYERLLSDDEARRKASELARKRALREHTYLRRASTLIELITSIG